MKTLLSLSLMIICINACYSQNVEEILDKAASVIGYQAENKIESMIISREILMENGIRARAITHYKKGGKLLVTTSIKEQSVDMKTIQGCNGTFCYSYDPMMGLRFIDGQEKEMVISQNSWTDWRDLYTKSELLGNEEIDNQKTYKIKLISESGMEVINFYDVESYLLIRSDVTTKTAAGKFTTLSTFSNYSIFENGIVMAKKVETSVNDRTLITILDNVEFNVEISEEKFIIPEQLK